MKDPVKDDLKRFGMFERFGAGRFFATVGEAVKAYVADFHVEWSDWEDDVRNRCAARGILRCDTARLE